MTNEPVRFDDSLSKFVETIASILGESATTSGAFLRDATGRLAFFAAQELDEAIVASLSDRLRESVGSYARPDRVVASAEDYGSKLVRSDDSALIVSVGRRRVRLVDRRLVGADWLRKPSPLASNPPRIVFASLKGGVGRSTALSIAAAHLSSRGRRVLAIDLDMEAPGLGAVLLNEGTLPEFGMVDALVENNLSGLDDRFLADLIGPSALADKRGSIDVIPAFGTRSLNNPSGVLAKLARAYAEDSLADGTTATILDQVRAIVDLFADPKRYDAILVDARAGLHETTASAVLGLGAEVLLFGLDEPQTFQGYSAMLSHLAQFLPADGSVPEWLDRITMVQGKASINVDEREAFSQKCSDLFSSVGFPTSTTQRITALLHTAEANSASASFNEIQWDDSVPDEVALPADDWTSETISILDDQRFARFDPSKKRDLLSEIVYRTSFGELIQKIDAVMSLPEPLE